MDHAGDVTVPLPRVGRRRSPSRTRRSRRHRRRRRARRKFAVARRHSMRAASHGVGRRRLERSVPLDSGGRAVRPTRTRVGESELLAMCSAIVMPMPPNPPVIRCTPSGLPGESRASGGRGTGSRSRIQRSPRRSTTRSVGHSASSSRTIASTRLAGVGERSASSVSMSMASVSTCPSSRGTTRTAPCSNARSGSSGSVRVERVDAARDQRQPHRLGPGGQRTGEEQHAGVVALDGLAVGEQLVVPTERRASTSARSTDRRHVDDRGGQRVLGRQAHRRA